MRKSVLAGVLAAVLLLSGCSGVSQEEYNSLLEENSKLKESSSSSESTSSKTSSSEISTSESKTSTRETNTSSSTSSTESTTSSVSTPDSTNEPNSSSSGNTSIDINEMLENGEAVISPLTGVIWLFSEDNSAYITNVGFETFADKSDDDKIGLCYLDALYFASDEKFADDYYLFLFWGEPNSNNVVASCTITHFLGETSIVDNSITWANEWEDFNNSDTNKKYIELVKNYDFSSETDNFELDGYKVNFTGKYDFDVLDNQFSAYNGQTLLTVNVDVENLSNNYGSRGYSYCTLSYNASAPDGSGLPSLDMYLGDSGISGSIIYVGQTFNGNLAVPYVGDGEYRFEFRDISGNRKYVYKIDVTKP